VKLVGECGSGRLVGGQIVGIEGAAKRIDVVATALTAGMTVEALINLDLSYAPAVLASLGSRADCSPSAREGIIGRKFKRAFLNRYRWRRRADDTIDEASGESFPANVPRR
jgi:hypothetical protein